MFDTSIDAGLIVVDNKMAAWRHQILMWRRVARGTCQRGIPASLTFVNSTHSASRNLTTKLISISRKDKSNPLWTALSVLEKMLVNLIKFINGLKSNYNDQWQNDKWQMTKMTHD